MKFHKLCFSGGGTHLCYQFMRKLFNKPIRQETTEMFYPNKMSLEEFRDKIFESIELFYKNLSTLNKTDDAFVEEWFETFLSWCEVEQE